MESKHKTEEACINLANSLIVQCQAPVPRIQVLSQLGSITFVHLFQCLCNKPLTGIIDYPQSVKDELHNMDILISSLATEVLNLSLSHLNSSDIVGGDPVAVHNLLEIFMGYYEFVLKTNVNSSVNNVLSKPNSQLLKQLNQENCICSVQLQETGNYEGLSEGSTADLIEECEDVVFENSDCSTSELIRESEEIAEKLGINVGKINTKNQFSSCINLDTECVRTDSLRAGVDDYKIASSTLEESFSDSDYYFMESDENEEQIDNLKTWPKNRSSINGRTPKLCKRKVYKKMTTLSKSTSASTSPSIEDSLSENSQKYKMKFKTLGLEENEEFYKESSNFISRSRNGHPSKEPGSSTSESSGKNLTSTINGKCDCMCHRNTLIERIHIIKRKQLQKKGYPSNSKSCPCCMNKKLGQRSTKSQSTNSKLKHKILSSLNEDLDERRICNYNKDLATEDRLTKETRVVASYKSRYGNCYKPYQSLRNRLVQCANTYGFYIPIKRTPKDMIELANSSRFLEERENIARLTVFDELLAYLKTELSIDEVTSNMKKEIITKYQRELQALVKLYLAKDDTMPASIKEYSSKLVALKTIISKQYKAAERKNEVQKRLQKCQSVQNQIRNHRILTAKFKRSFDSSHIEIQSQIRKERAKEEQMLQELFGKGLATKKQKLKELQKCTKEMKGLMSSQYKEELKTLENFYLTQIEMLAEGLVSEQMELKAKEKAQLKILEQLKEEFQQKLQKVQKADKLKDEQVHSCCRNEKNLKTYL